MNMLRIFLRKFSKNLLHSKKDFYIALLISAIMHVFLLYFVFSISSVQPLNMESVEVDFTMTSSIGKPYNANKNGEGGGANGKSEKKTLKTQQAKNKKSITTKNENSRKDSRDSMDSIDDIAESMLTDVVSLNALTSDNDKYGSKNIAGRYKGEKNGNSTFGNTEGTGGGSFGLSGQGREGRAYDFGYIREAIMKNLQYPEKARRFGWEGKVVLHFIINETGLVRDIKIVRSSGVQMLDNAAKDALLRVAAFRNKHKRLVTVQLPIEFKLKQ